MNYEIAVLVGSLRAQSINMQLARALEKLLPSHVKFTYADLDIPLFNQDLENDMPAPAARMKALVKASQGVLFVTPEHNRSLPAALKNAIDWGTRPRGTNVWTGKPSAVVGTSPSPVGTGIAQQHLRTILAAAGTPMLTTPEIFLQMKEGLIDGDHNFTNEDTRKFLQGWVDLYVAWVAKLNAAHSPKVPRARSNGRLVVFFEFHAYLQPDLPMRDLAVLDMAAYARNLEPLQIA